MPLEIKELSFLRGVDHWTPDLGAKLAEALHSAQQAINNLEAQTNGNVTGSPQPPPKLGGISVTGQNGYLHVAIQHDAHFYRGINYFVEHADNAQFTDPHVVPMGAARNISIPVGGTRYVRAYASYASSPPNEPVYHGSQVEPIAVDAGAGGPALLPSQGSGTGQPGVGLQGPGREPFRPVAGAPPVR